MDGAYVCRGEPRVDVDFPVVLRKGGGHFYIENGVTMNLSQTGALISIESQKEFEIDDRIVLTFRIPTSFSGRDSTVFLQGSGVITRLDQVKRAVAAQFDDSFKMFERIHET